MTTVKSVFPTCFMIFDFKCHQTHVITRANCLLYQFFFTQIGKQGIVFPYNGNTVIPSQIFLSALNTYNIQIHTLFGLVGAYLHSDNTCLVTSKCHDAV